MEEAPRRNHNIGIQWKNRRRWEDYGMIEAVDILICILALCQYLVNRLKVQGESRKHLRLATRIPHKRVAWWQRLLSCYLHYCDDDRRHDHVHCMWPYHPA